MNWKLLCSQLRPIAITSCESHAAEAKFALLSQVNFFERFVQHQSLKTTNGSADRNSLASLYSSVQRSDSTFGRAITILQPSTRSPALRHINCERFAANINKGEFREFLLRIFTAGCSKHRGRRAKNRNVLATQPWNQIRSEPRRLFVHNHQRCSRGKSKPDFFNR